MGTAGTAQKDGVDKIEELTNLVAQSDEYHISMLVAENTCLACKKLYTNAAFLRGCLHIACFNCFINTAQCPHCARAVTSVLEIVPFKAANIVVAALRQLSPSLLPRLPVDNVDHLPVAETANEETKPTEDNPAINTAETTNDAKTRDQSDKKMLADTSNDPKLDPKNNANVGPIWQPLIKTDWVLPVLSTSDTTQSMFRSDSIVVTAAVSVNRKGETVAHGIAGEQRTHAPDSRSQSTQSTNHASQAAWMRMLAGCDLNFPDFAGWTPLHEAAVYGNYLFAKFLLDQGVAVDACGEKYTTALHKAVLAGHRDLVRLLLEYGADKFHRNVRGQNAHDLAEGNQELLSILSTTNRKCFVPTRYFVARELVVYADPSVDGTHVTPLRSNCAQIALVRDELVSKSLVNCFLDYSKQASFMTLVAILRGAMIVTDPQWCLTYEVRKHDTHPICHLAREPSGIQRAVANRLLHRPPLFHGMLFYVREIGQSGVRESRSTKRSSNRSKSSASSSQEDITTTAIRLAAGLGRADIKTLVEVGGGKIRKWSPPMLTTQAAATPSTSRGAKRRSTRLRDSNKSATSATLDASINSDATSTSTTAATSANYPYHCNKGRRVNISDAAEDECGDDAGVPSVHVVIVNKSTIDDLDTVAPPGVWFKTTQWLVESVLRFQVVLDE